MALNVTSSLAFLVPNVYGYVVYLFQDMYGIFSTWLRTFEGTFIRTVVPSKGIWIPSKVVYLGNIYGFQIFPVSTLPPRYYQSFLLLTLVGIGR